MAAAIQRLFILGALLLGLSQGLAAQESDLTGSFNNQINRLTSDEDLSPEERQIQARARQLVIEALNLYQDKNYKQSIRSLEKAVGLLGEDEALEALKDSLERLVALREQSDAFDKNQEPEKAKKVKLDWSSGAARALDRNRYLIGLTFATDFNTYKLPDYGRLRLGLSARFEGFLPYAERRFGLLAEFDSLFVNVDTARKVSDYEIWNYKVAFQWRFSWNLPAVEERVTLALHLGMASQKTRMLTEGSFPQESLSYYMLPFVGVYIQDALLNHFFRNDFTKNLLFTPHLSFAWLPAGRYPSTVFDIGIGIKYRFGNFIIGPEYRFKYQYSLKTRIEARYSIWSLTLAYQY